MLGILNYGKELVKLPPPLTKSEINAFERGDDGCIEISIAKFRLDFKQDRDSAFNKTAVTILAKDLIDRVKIDNWYPTPPIPDKYLVQGYVEMLFYNHFKYVATRMRQYDEASPERNARLKENARSARKTRVSAQ